MKTLASLLVLTAAVGAVACSANSPSAGGTGNVATRDAAATKTCDDVRLFALDRAGLSAREVLDRVGTLYTDVQGSANAVIRARAVALYVDAEQSAEGGGPGSSFRADLEALRSACSAPAS